MVHVFAFARGRDETRTHEAIQVVIQRRPRNVDLLLRMVDLALRNVDLPLRIVDVPLRIVDVPLRIVDVPLRIVDVPLRIVGVPLRIVDVPLRIVDVGQRSHIYKGCVHSACPTFRGIQWNSRYLGNRP